MHDTLDDWPRPLALVLSGGAALGAVQVGMLRALAERGCRPDLVVGTSIGAINGAFIAHRGLTLERVAELTHLWQALTASDIFTGLGLAGLLRIATGHGTLCSERGLRRILGRHFPLRHSDLAVPFHAVALELAEGRSAVLSGPSLHTGLMASAAIPLVFPKIVSEGKRYVDGGLIANCPLVEAEALGARTLVVLDAGFPCRLPRPPTTTLGELLYAFQVAMRHHAELTLRLLRPTTSVLYLPIPCPLELAHHDFGGAQRLIDPAYEAALDFLTRLGEPTPGIHGHPHHHPPMESTIPERPV